MSDVSEYCLSLGKNAQAVGYCCIALGNNTYVCGIYSSAVGDQIYATDDEIKQSLELKNQKVESIRIIFDKFKCNCKDQSRIDKIQTWLDNYIASLFVDHE